MFSDIFPDNQNRLVYKGGPEGPKLTQIYIGGKERADALLNVNKNKEAAKDHTIKDIDRILDEIISAGKDNIKAKGAKPLNREEREIVESLRNIKKKLQNRNVKVLDIYNATAQVKGTLQIYNAISKGDPLRGAFAVQETKMPELQKKAPKRLAGKKESVEATKWAKLSDNVKEYRKLGSTPKDRAKKGKLKPVIRQLAATLIGRKQKIEKGDVAITRKPGNKLQIAIKMPRHELEQGGRPKAKTVGRTEYLNV